MKYVGRFSVERAMCKKKWRDEKINQKGEKIKIK
jgi:hypothetical protein